MSWLADKIEQWPTAKLLPYARNARTHPDEQVAQIAASIAEFGFTNPILAGSDGVIVAGHGRLAAAQKLGLEIVPVVVLDHLTAIRRNSRPLQSISFHSLCHGMSTIKSCRLDYLQITAHCNRDEVFFGKCSPRLSGRACWPPSQLVGGRCLWVITCELAAQPEIHPADARIQ